MFELAAERVFHRALQDDLVSVRSAARLVHLCVRAHLPGLQKRSARGCVCSLEFRLLDEASAASREPKKGLCWFVASGLAGYGSEPCPMWEKDVHSADYEKRCANG